MTSEITNGDSPVKPTHSLRKHGLWIATVAISWLAVYGMYAWQHGQVNDLRRQLANQSDTYSASTHSKKDTKSAVLERENTDLAKALRQLQDQRAVAATTTNTEKSPQSVEPAQPAGKLAIASVKDNQPLSDFDTPEFTFKNGGSVKAIYVNMTNLTSSTQDYSLFQFYGTSSTGVVVQPVQYAMSPTKKVWWSSQITAGGSQDVALMFPAGTNIVTLNWTPPGGTATYNFSLPTPN